jgi:O-antigen/teichoic acid export membrane protein
MLETSSKIEVGCKKNRIFAPSTPCPHKRMSHSELKKKTTISLFWNFLDRFGEQLIYLMSSIVLMNILTPAEYGLMGVLLIFIAVSRLLADSGFGRALLNRETVSETELSSVFYFNIGLSFLLYVIFFLCAPLIGNIFHEPRLGAISKVLFLGFVFHSFGIIPQMLLIKKADFRGLTRINIPALLTAAVVAIAMAMNGFGVWALVAQSVIYAFLRTLFLWIYSTWRPVARFSLRVLQSFFAFSNKLLLSGFIATFFNNIYPSIIAFFYPNSMNQVGYFSQANKYQDIPFGVIANTFRMVSMTILTEINREVERIKRVIGKNMKSIAFLVFPIGLFMILAAESAFYLLFGERWLPAVPYFRGLTLAGMLSPFTFILNELFIARRRADFFLGVEIVKRVILVLLIVLLFGYGIMGLVASWVIYTFITLIISLVLSRKLIDYTPLDFLKDTSPYLLIALASAAIGYAATLRISNNALFLIISAIAVFGSYWLICKIAKMEMTKEIESWIFRK